MAGAVIPHFGIEGELNASPHSKALEQWPGNHIPFGLLKAVALVAPVPRQEDVGNDAFVTLIRPDGGQAACA
jgi:hypothetical protein